MNYFMDYYTAYCTNCFLYYYVGSYPSYYITLDGTITYY